MGVRDNYIPLSLVSKKPARALEDGPNSWMGWSLTQEWLEEPGEKQGLDEGLHIRQSWPGRDGGVKQQACHIKV